MNASELFAGTPVRAAAIAAAYLLGAVPFGVIVTRLVAKKDVREVGSGNIGATNVARAAGKGPAILVLVLDALKGFLPALLLERLLVAPAPAEQAASLALWPAAAGVAAIVGHVWPVYLRFRGGKGVATALGASLVFAWPAALAGAAVWLGVFLATRTSSLGSLLAAATALGVAWFAAPHPAYFAGMAAAVLLIGVRHAGNIRRLWSRTEARF